MCGTTLMENRPLLYYANIIHAWKMQSHCYGDLRLSAKEKEVGGRAFKKNILQELTLKL